MGDNFAKARETALQFADALVCRDYTRAYKMTTENYQRTITTEDVRECYEGMIPDDWGPMSDVSIVDDVVTDLPNKPLGEIGWIYVSLVGTVYPWSEGIFMQLLEIEGEVRINEVDFGRP
jgi:hypothetical protein